MRDSSENSETSKAELERIKKILKNLPKDFLAMVQGQHWRLSAEDFSLETINVFMSNLKHAQIRSLNLGYNQDPHSIKMISTCNFVNLDELNLYCNNIQSIELLSRVFFPNLRSLRLDFNQITSIKTLEKCFTDNLECLDLRDNFITELTLGKLNSPKLTSIFSEGEWYETVQAQSHRWVIKTNIRHLVDYFCMKKPSHSQISHIYEPQVLKVLRKKFQKLKFCRFPIPEKRQN